MYLANLYSLSWQTTSIIFHIGGAPWKHLAGFCLGQEFIVQIYLLGSSYINFLPNGLRQKWPSIIEEDIPLLKKAMDKHSETVWHGVVKALKSDANFLR